MGKKGEGGEQTNPLAVVLYMRKRGNKVKTLRNPLTKESGNGVTNIKGLMFSDRCPSRSPLSNLHSWILV